MKIKEGRATSGKRRATAFIGIGSNLGDRISNCKKAVSLIEQSGIKIKKLSRWYETEAFGKFGPVDGPPFINGAAEVSTSLSPEELLSALMEIEKSFGRPFPRQKGEPRAIDLDILFYGSLILETKRLQIPHPELAKRLFVLIPLCDIAPALVHPVLGRTVRELKIGCRKGNRSWVRLFAE